MNKKHDPGLIMILLTITLFSVFINGCESFSKEPVDYVDPTIGSIGHLLRSTSPIVQLPHSRVTLTPFTTPGIRDRYLADKIYGFPIGLSSMMITTGKLSINAAENASRFDHDLEVVTPYYYSVLLEDYNIEVEFSVTENAAYYRFKFYEATTSNLVIQMLRGARIGIHGDKVIEGYETRYRRGRAGKREYFYCIVNKPWKISGSWQDTEIDQNVMNQSGDNIGVYVSFPVVRGEQIDLRIGFSDNSVDEARRFLENELPSFNFEEVKQTARDSWNKALSKIEVAGGSEEQRTIFYTALYRTMGRKGNVWDTYRCAYPLQTIIDPEVNLEVIRGFIKEYEETGWLPSSGAMIGNHATPVILDAYQKGITDFDVQKAYEGMKKNAMEATMIPWRDRGPLTELETVYFEKGFFPALPLGADEWIPQVHGFERRQSVAVTLEHCYDDWCLAQMARTLGKDDDDKYFMKRAHNYKNLYDARIGFMAPKTADGKWIEPFDPKLSGGQGGRAYFAECNSWTYTWHVQHDVQGLINLMGGRDQFVKRLDALFVEQYGMLKFKFLNQFPDATGLIGQYAQGNEPSFHIPYLYNYAGTPWKTQRRVREIMKVWYDDDPLGICGDEDGGSMSAWYVFSAMGFYPVCPGRPLYDIGSPVFEKIKINVADGKSFVIEAKDVSSKNKYIQSANLNGKPLNKPWFEHSVIINGGKLTLQMGDRPNKEWGRVPEAAPPSMSF
jgi:putative alpha-1,2-mannosidase